jgi:hypothetical protein
MLPFVQHLPFGNRSSGCGRDRLTAQRPFCRAGPAVCSCGLLLKNAAATPINRCGPILGEPTETAGGAISNRHATTLGIALVNKVRMAQPVETSNWSRTESSSRPGVVP